MARYTIFALQGFEDGLINALLADFVISQTLYLLNYGLTTFDMQKDKTKCSLVLVINTKRPSSG